MSGTERIEYFKAHIVSCVHVLLARIAKTDKEPRTHEMIVPLLVCPVVLYRVLVRPACQDIL